MATQAQIDATGLYGFDLANGGASLGFWEEDVREVFWTGSEIAVHYDSRSLAIIRTSPFGPRATVTSTSGGGNSVNSRLRALLVMADGGSYTVSGVAVMRARSGTLEPALATSVVTQSVTTSNATQTASTRPTNPRKDGGPPITSPRHRLNTFITVHSFCTEFSAWVSSTKATDVVLPGPCMPVQTRQQGHLLLQF